VTRLLDAVIFDMDGVLIDSTPLHATAFLRALGPHGIDTLDYDAIAGMRTPDALRKIFADRGRSVDDATVERLTLEKRRCFRDLTSEGPPFVDGAVDVVRSVQAAGYRVALASSGSAPSVAAFVRESGLAEVFDVVLHGDDVARAKPDPSIYVLAADRLGVPAGRTLVVEDSASGIAAGLAAGARVVAFRPSAAALVRLGTARVERVDDLRDVLRILAHDEGGPHRG
jgi:HAD superfamily hydrolase (TIGR01509 family)